MAICSMEGVSALPSSAQTVIQATVQRPTTLPSVTPESLTKVNSPTGISKSSRTCFQVDASSRMYIRDENGGVHYYLANDSSSYAKTMTQYPRCS